MCRKSSDHVLLTQRDMNQIPQYVDQRCLDLLNSMNAVRGYDQAIISNLGEAAAILARECNRHQTAASRRLERVYEVGGLAACADRQGHVARLTDKAELIDENPGELHVVADGGQVSDIRDQGFGGKSAPVFDDRVLEFDRDMKSIAGAPAVTHDQELVTFAETCRHFIAKHSDTLGVVVEKFLLHLNALANLAEYRVFHAHITYSQSDAG